MLPNHILALVLGFVLDLLIGDPYCFPHPIRFIGNLISKLETRLRKEDNEKKLLGRGVLLVILVVFISTAIPLFLLWTAYQINLWLGLLIETIMCYQILATKSLKVESMKVYLALKTGNLLAARRAVSMIVGRDTESLTQDGIIKATVETVAENTSDGIIAPMIFIALGGPVLGFFYKAVNTMDSMVGYKNETYLYFGRAAAKLDDLLNYIPARISAILMVISGFILGLDGKSAFRIWRRDGRKHASPNSAQTEAAAAGALQIQLAGDAIYFGKLHQKPTIGDHTRDVEIEDIKRANRLLYGTAVLQVILMVLISMLKSRTELIKW